METRIDTVADTEGRKGRRNDPQLKPSEVNPRDELRPFLEQLSIEIQQNDYKNSETHRYVDAASGLVGALEHRFGAVPSEGPTWAMVATIFDAATVYE